MVGFTNVKNVRRVPVQSIQQIVSSHVASRQAPARPQDGGRKWGHLGAAAAGAVFGAAVAVTIVIAVPKSSARATAAPVAIQKAADPAPARPTPNTWSNVAEFGREPIGAESGTFHTATGSEGGQAGYLDRSGWAVEPVVETSQFAESASAATPSKPPTILDRPQPSNAANAAGASAAH